MPAARIIEAVDVLKDGGFCLAAGFPSPAPDQLGLDGLEERLDNGVDAPMEPLTNRANVSVFPDHGDPGLISAIVDRFQCYFRGKTRALTTCRRNSPVRRDSIASKHAASCKDWQAHREPQSASHSSPGPGSGHG